MILTDLIARHIGEQPGTDAGTCYICGRRTDHGHRQPPSSLFTDWARCVGGDVRCPACSACLSHRSVRHVPWLVTTEAFRPHTKADHGWLWQTIMDPPEPPYALYVTRSGQKQGWLAIVHQVSQSRAMAIGTDWTDAPVWITDRERATLGPLILRLRERGVGKRDLARGVSFAKTWQDAIANGWDDDLIAAKRQAGNPAWEVMVSASA